MKRAERVLRDQLAAVVARAQSAGVGPGELCRALSEQTDLVLAPAVAEWDKALRVDRCA